VSALKVRNPETREWESIRCIKGDPGEQGPQGPQGEQGETGAQGAPGYTPVRGVDYWTDEDQTTIETFIADELAKRGQLKPEFANSVEECTDTNKLYVLPDGFIYAYVKHETEAVIPNIYTEYPAQLNMRMDSSGAVKSYNGSLLIGPIDVSLTSPYLLRVSGLTLEANYSKMIAVNYFSSAGAFLGFNSAAVLNNAVNGLTLQLSDGVYECDIYDADYAAAASIYIKLGISADTATAITAEDVTGLFVELEPKNTPSETVYGWTNTGHAFVPADYEDRIVSLENAVTQLQVGGSSEVSIPSFWENAVNECISKIKSLQVGRNCVTFPFFSDNHQRNGYSGVLIRRVMDECNIPFCFYGGDSISSGYIASEEVMVAQDKVFDSMMKAIPNGRFCRAVGNHDGYWAVSATEKHTYTREQVYELFLREEAIAQNKHFGDDGTYYYVDDIASKVRFVVMNTNGGSVDDTQIAWFQNTALAFNESGWAVVFISHQPISNHYHANISNAAEVRSVVSSYINGSSTNKADVVGWFSGHIHRDRIYTGVAINTADDSVGANMPFKQVTITSDHTGIAYDDATLHTVAEDDQSHAIDFVTINKTTRTVNITRLGIGNDRSYTY
jgi:hypothetical protein